MLKEESDYGSDWEVVIGLEVHAQLNTRTKLFCGCAASFGAEPNTHVCPVCLGHPGTLPVLNAAALEKAAYLGLALGSRVNLHSIFERKNYFYPDLPKAYQISQLKNPVCEGGGVVIYDRGVERVVEVERIQIEEDAGKLIHSEDALARESYVDLNRCGTPLLEIVSKPQIYSVEQALEYFKSLRSLLLYLGVSDCNMEEGSLRCDVNVSVRERGDKELGNRTEIKNMNTFKGIEAALDYEIRRQIRVREGGGEVRVETLLFDVQKRETRAMRSKEEAQDYRYFADPDLVPAYIGEAAIKRLRDSLPELPKEKRRRFRSNYGLSEYDTMLLVESRALSTYFEAAVLEVSEAPKKVCNWITTEVLSILNREQITIEEFSKRLEPRRLGELVRLIHEGKLSGKLAKQLFPKLLGSGRSASELIEESGVRVLSDSGELLLLVEKVIERNPEAVKSYRDGGDRVLGFFVGQVMRETRGQADPVLVNKFLKQKLGEGIG